jgi:hypothetical protein
MCFLNAKWKVVVLETGWLSEIGVESKKQPENLQWM